MDSPTSIFQVLFAYLPTMQDMIPLISMIAFIAGGAILISAGVRERSEVMSRRIASVRKDVRNEIGASQSGNDGRRTRTTSGLSEDEHRQLVRMLGRYSTSESETSHHSASVSISSEAEHRQLVRVFTRYSIDEEKIPTYFSGIRLILAVLAGIPAFLFIPLPSPLLSIGVALLAGLIGWYIPVYWIKKSLRRHYKDVGNGLPDALELLAICIEAGLSLENGLHRIAQEIKPAQPALADELAFTWAEISILPSRDQALENLAKRVDIAIVRSIVSTLAQSLRYGSPLAKSLRMAAEEMRNEQFTALEERANRLPALMTIPVMVMIMPTIFLIVGGPAVLRILDVFASK